MFLVDDWTVTDVGNGFWRIRVRFVTDHDTTLTVYVQSYLHTATIGFNFGGNFLSTGQAGTSSSNILYKGDGNSGFFWQNQTLKPVNPSALVIDESLIIGDTIQRLATGDKGNGVPNWKVTVRYARNYTVQSGTEVFGSATDAHRTFVATEWRSTVPAENSAVRDQHLLAGELVADTELTYERRTDYEVSRLFHLYSSSRSAYQIEVDLLLGFDADIGTIVTLQAPRFGLDAGKNFVVIGRTENFEKKTATLVLWG